MNGGEKTRMAGIILVLLTLAAGVFLPFFIYDTALRSGRAALGEELVLLTKTASHHIDGNAFKTMFTDPALNSPEEYLKAFQRTAKTSEYAQFQEKLKKAVRSHPELKYENAYILARDRLSKKHMRRAVALKEPSLLGKRQELTPTMLAVLNLSTRGGMEERGIAGRDFVSAYSPIMDSRGKTHGLVTMDVGIAESRKVRFVMERAHVMAGASVFLAVLALVAGILLLRLIARGGAFAAAEGKEPEADRGASEELSEYFVAEKTAHIIDNTSRLAGLLATRICANLVRRTSRADAEALRTTVIRTLACAAECGTSDQRTTVETVLNKNTFALRVTKEEPFHEELAAKIGAEPVGFDEMNASEGGNQVTLIKRFDVDY